MTNNHGIFFNGRDKETDKTKLQHPNPLNMAVSSTQGVLSTLDSQMLLDKFMNYLEWTTPPKHHFQHLLSNFKGTKTSKRLPSPKKSRSLPFSLGLLPDFPWITFCISARRHAAWTKSARTGTSRPSFLVSETTRFRGQDFCFVWLVG